jgi:hypothetical protein
MRLLFLSMLFFCSVQAMAQCKTYKLSSKGDTLNCVDKNDTKRGKWVFHVESLRGNPGYDEEGVYVADRREGLWRRYNLMGDLVAIQNYKWGNLDSISQYYTIAGLEREESWRAMNPDKAYDTLEVQDVNNENKFINVIIKNEGKSMKHGTWTWYRPGSMSIIKSEVYILNKLKVPGEKTAIGGDANATDSSSTTAKKPEPKKEKPKEVQDFEKKNSGKKATKVRDGKTG